MRRTADETARTRAAIVSSARDLFSARGFAATSTSEIVRAAGVTRGALYHHFADKTDLFRAVFADLEAELNAAVITAAAAHTDPLAAFRAGCEACLDFMVRPDYQQIATVDGPAVLGWAEWHRIDADIGLTSMQVGLDTLARAGIISIVPTRATAVLLFGALTEAGLVLGRDDSSVTKRELLDGFLDLVTRLGAGARAT